MRTLRKSKTISGLMFLAVGILGLSGCGGDSKTAEGCAAMGGEFCVEAADRALADSYNASYDWTSDKVALRVLNGPTRSEAEKALYYRNPGLFQDPSNEPQITPDPLPSLDAGPAGFDFELSDLAPNPNTQFLDNSSIVDSLSQTPITAAEQANAPLWLPAVLVFLSVDWDSSKVLNLYYGNTAVKGQKWGASGTTLPPQTIGHMYLHGGEIWVEIVFENHVALGAGISDSDGDGYKEIYAKVDPSHYTAEVVDELVDNYMGAELTVPELSNLIQNKIVDDLYASFPMQLHSEQGVSFDMPGGESVTYPFLVLNGFSPRDDIYIVLLVNP